MKFGGFASLLSLVALGDAAVVHSRYDKIAKTDNVKLYAFGDGIAGYEIFYGEDKKAYLSATATEGLTDITWNIDTKGGVSWNVTSTDNSTVADSTFYVVTQDNAYNQAGFTKHNQSLPSGATEVGFKTYGPYVMLVSDKYYISEFWAKATNTSGVWALMWNQDGSAQDDSIVVSLRTTPPV